MPHHLSTSQVVFPTNILYQFREKFEVRANEWFFALSFIMFGLSLIVWPHMFDRPFYNSFRKFGPQTTWAGVVLTIGIIRFLALIVNGGWKATPVIRTVTGFLSCGIWLEISLGLSYEPRGTLGISVYPIILIAEIYNVYRSAGDIWLTNNHVKNQSASKVC